jgi:hypothetical protein
VIYVFLLAGIKRGLERVIRFLGLPQSIKLGDLEQQELTVSVLEA